MNITFNNPSKEECITYLRKKAKFFHLPLPLVLATVQVESNFKQFSSEGTPLQNKESPDFGIMQINCNHKEYNSDWATISDSDWYRILYDWKRNIDFGMELLAACYILALSRKEDEKGAIHFNRTAPQEFLARASYSCYNGGSHRIGRYRTIQDRILPNINAQGYDQRDCNFLSLWKNYTDIDMF